MGQARCDGGRPTPPGLESSNGTSTPPCAS